MIPPQWKERSMSELLLISQNKEFLGLWLSKCSPWTSSNLRTRCKWTALLNQAVRQWGPAARFSLSPLVDPNAHPLVLGPARGCIIWRPFWWERLEFS